MPQNASRSVRVQEITEERQLELQVDAALDRAADAGRYDESLFTAAELAVGIQSMRKSAQTSRNLLASYGLI